MKKQSLLIILILAFIFTTLLLSNIFNKSLLWDENAYLANAREHLRGSNYQEDFRFPLLEWIIAFLWLITGESLWVAKSLIIFFTLGTIFLTYLISKEYYNQNNSIVQTLFVLSFALSPLILIWGFRIYADMAMLFFIVLSFFMVLKAQYNKPLLYISVAGIGSALAFLSRFTAVIFLGCLVLYLIYKKDYKKTLFLILFFTLSISPWLIYNYLQYHNPLWDLIEQYRVVEAWTSPEPILKQIKNLFLNTGILILLALGEICRNIKNSITNKKILKEIKSFISLFTIISAVYFLFFVNMKYSRYLLMFLPFIYILAFDAYANLQKKLMKKKIYGKILTLILVLNIIILFFYGIGQASPQFYCDGDSVGETLNYLKPLADEIRNNNETVLSNFWPYFGYGLNVKTASLWSKNPDDFFNSYKLRYIVYSNTGGEDYNKTILENHKNLLLEKQFKDKCQIINLYSAKDNR
jgi:4-amino-4-deoxy-L-arabinose transferase-like glycosyltransferase